nr:receptor-type tyrosine-protein phosphatase eta-like [Monopterus albus]
MLLPTTDDKYIEDSCVAVLRFGAWVERNCLDLLPFVCYEDRFTGQVNKSNVTSSSASLAWQPGPGNISHYRLEVNGDKNVTCDNLTYHLDLDSLTPGTRYEVKVFAVKCERDLNPQVVSFYTKPGQVKNLKDTMVTDTSITLSWNKPDGNVDFYLIEFNNRLINSSTTNTTVVDLTPGNLYTFTVTSRVADNSLWSEESRTNVYTRPGKVSNLMVSDNTNMSLVLSWAPPVGNTSGFWVKAMNDNNHDLFQRKMSKTELNVTVTNLPEGTRITLSVTALANGFLEGDNETIVSYTAPGPISNLSLSTTSSSLNATWVPHAGSHSNFTIELQLDGKTTRTTLTTTPNVTFGDLKTAANYTVIVCSVSGQFKSPPVQSSIFTLPTPPSNAVANSSNKNSIVFNWKAPANIATAKYNVTLSSTFWGQRWSDTVVNQLSYTFDGLTSGTKYYFEVRTVAGQQESDPATVTHYTVAEKTEISLSALCSSAEPLLCATDATKDVVLQQLKARFTELLGDNVVWDLKKQESENKAKAI